MQNSRFKMVNSGFLAYLDRQIDSGKRPAAKPAPAYRAPKPSPALVTRSVAAVLARIGV